jgi:cysteine desulfurase
MIYLDHNATTPIDPQVAQAMERYIHKDFGNPSSSYALGKKSREAVEEAREKVAKLLCCNPHEIVFTSGGTESNNTVIKGVVNNLKARGNHIITTSIEHPSIINPCLFLMNQGYDITFVPVDKYGVVDPDNIKKAINKKTILISVMHANNETGTIQPIDDIAHITREAGVYFHTDAAQSVGKMTCDVGALGVDFLSVAGHKCYAPKGVGALYIRDGATLEALLHGGGQEKGLRAGTENVIMIVGLGVACDLARNLMEKDADRIRYLRDKLYELLNKGLVQVILNGHPLERLPNTLNVSFPDVIGSAILEGLPEICASTGAACHDRQATISHVLSAMGVPPHVATGAIRLTLGRHTTESEINRAAELIIAFVKGKKGMDDVEIYE